MVRGRDGGMIEMSRSDLDGLLKGSNVKPRVKRELRFVPEEIGEWEDRDFLAVFNKSRSEGVLIVPLDRTYIIQFRLQKRMPNKTGRVEAIICDFCATWQRGSNSAIISFDRTDKSSASFLCCADLECSLHVRDKTSESAISRTQLRENNTVEDRIERLIDRLGSKIISN